MNEIASGLIRCSVRSIVSGVFQVLVLFLLVSSSGWTAEPEMRTWGETYFDDMSAPEAAEKLASILANELVRPSLSELTTTYSASHWSSAALVAEIALEVSRGVDAGDTAGGDEVRLGKLRAYGRVPCPMTSGPPTYEAVAGGFDDESIAQMIRRHARRFEWNEALSLGRSNLADRHVHCELVVEGPRSSSSVASIQSRRPTGFGSSLLSGAWSSFGFGGLVSMAVSIPKSICSSGCQTPFSTPIRPS